MWEDGDSEDDFYFPMHANEMSGVAEAGNVIATTVCTESKEKEETIIISWCV